MIRIDVTPSADLARLLDQPQALLDRAGALGARRAAESYTDAVRDWIDAGRAFTARTGHLEQSLNWLPTPDGAEVFAQADYAPWVEYGTQPHEIRPKPGRKALRWFGGGPGGGQRFARVVHHPGTNPLPFFFADLDARKTDMQEEARLALAEVLLGAGATA